MTSLLTTGTPTAYKDYIYDGTDFVLYSGTEALADGKCYLPGTAAKTVTGTTVDAVKIVTPTNGTITAAQSSTTVTLTATPSGGYYITAADIVVTKTAPNGKALARGLAEKLAVTAGTVDATGKGTYTFTLPEGYGAVVEATFTAQTDISGATVKLDWTEKEYKPGTEQKATVTKVTLNGTDLSATDDYGVTYNETAWINQGTYTINVTGKGKYKGTATTTFTIAPKPISEFTLTGIPEGGFIYDGTAKTVGVAYNNGTEDITISDSEYTMTYKLGTADATELKNAGTYTVTVTDKTDGNYTINGSKTLTIAPKSVSTTADHHVDSY